MPLTKEQILVGDRVQRKPINNFDRSGMIGTVVELVPPNRVKIKWDVKQSNGQQHSTIQTRFLIKENFK